MRWSDNQIKQLKRLKREGYSATQIAERMAGVTRNAVLGKLYRLGLCEPKSADRPYWKRTA